MTSRDYLLDKGIHWDLSGSKFIFGSKHSLGTYETKWSGDKQLPWSKENLALVPTLTQISFVTLGNWHHFFGNWFPHLENENVDYIISVAAFSSEFYDSLT